MNISRMKKEELQQVAALEAENFTMPWSEKSFEEALSNEDALYLTAKEGEKVIGVCGLFNHFGEADIQNVSVAKSMQGQGIGTAMMKSLLAEGERLGITSFTLEVRVSNLPAIRIYEKLGFSFEGIRKNFYEKPREDAMIMWKR